MSGKNAVSPQGRESFKSSFGVVAAAIGSAVGLGNIWRFPYITGKYGGAAFLLVYLLSAALIGVPIMLAEFIVGREAKKDAVGSFQKLAPDKKWYIGGILQVLASFMILAFYGVIAGWTLKYLICAAANGFAGKDAAALEAMFHDFKSHPFKPLLWQILFMGITGLVVAAGVEKGIEKFSKMLIPLLAVLIIVLNIRAVTLPGGRAGLVFLFKPDFSKLTGSGILAALGQSFFSLSLGMGIMITYGSYMSEKEKLGATALQTVAVDTLIAVLCGVAIFPAVFSNGIAPDSGPGLIFITLPNVFPKMPGGYLFGIMFFGLVAVAALTSTISLLEAVTAFGIDHFGWPRKKSTIICFTAITIVGILSSLSNGVLAQFSIFGRNLFDFLDYFSSSFLLTTAALVTSLFVGWRFDKEVVKKQLTNDGSSAAPYFGIFRFTIKYITPVLIVIIFISGVLTS
ncbi:MAG TPA: sodium-dependent transporter [Firmicutes bacterium]|nr:sodium-dependent transporter [Bacillota bacterium]